MAKFAVCYGFSQRFPFPARQAYEWCVDYRADDWGRMGRDGVRKIKRVDDYTLVLDDTVRTGNKSQTKRRLVKLYPELLMWTNTRVSEANRYSQFIYRIIPEGEKSSRLEFTGAQVNEARKKPTAAQVASISADNAKEDAALWVLLAKEMKKDLGASN